MLRTSRIYVAHLQRTHAYDTFRSVFDLFGEQLPRCSTKISIKVNLCEYRRAESGATTDPFILGSLLELLKDLYPSAKVYILENDATSVDAATLFSLLGFREVAERHGALLFNVAQGRWIKKPVPHPRILPELEVPAILEESDLFINFAKLKTNALTKTTGAIKNIFAFYRAKRKVVFHGRIDDVLLDMNKVIHPHLCLVDGYIGMEGRGPAFGRPKRCELLVSGVDPVAVDACSARVMGFNPWFVRHIRMCHREGLGSIRYHLETDIRNFAYSKYRFEYNYFEHLAKQLLRKRLGVGLG